MSKAPLVIAVFASLLVVTPAVRAVQQMDSAPAQPAQAAPQPQSDNGGGARYLKPKHRRIPASSRLLKPKRRAPMSGGSATPTPPPPTPRVD